MEYLNKSIFLLIFTFFQNINEIKLKAIYKLYDDLT